MRESKSGQGRSIQVTLRIAPFGPQESNGDRRPTMRPWLEEQRKQNLADGLDQAAAEVREYSETLEAIAQGIDILRPANVWSPTNGSVSPLRSIGVEFARHWGRLKGSSADFERFRAGPYPQAIPSWWLSAKLYGWLMTRQGKFKRGDAYDVRHASTALPYVHFFVTDDRLRRRLEKYGEGDNRPFGTHVASIRTLEQLLGEIP